MPFSTLKQQKNKILKTLVQVWASSNNKLFLLEKSALPHFIENCMFFTWKILPWFNSFRNSNRNENTLHLQQKKGKKNLEEQCWPDPYAILGPPAQSWSRTDIIHLLPSHLKFSACTRVPPGIFNSSLILRPFLFAQTCHLHSVHLPWPHWKANEAVQVWVNVPMLTLPDFVQSQAAHKALPPEKKRKRRMEAHDRPPDYRYTTEAWRQQHLLQTNPNGKQLTLLHERWWLRGVLETPVRWVAVNYRKKYNFPYMGLALEYLLSIHAPYFLLQ